MENTRIDIIIVNFNSTKCLLECLKSIKATAGSTDIQILVIDNNSSEDVDRIDKAFDRVELIRNSENRGFGAAINQGIKASSAAYLLLLNPDTLLTKGFFESAIDYMEAHPEVGVLGPKILDQDGSLQGSARAFPNALTALYGRSSPLTKYFPNNPISRANIMTLGSNGKSIIEPDWVSGACMFVRRKAIEEAGLMDERFFMYWEDADLCRRVKEKGWQVVYFPAISVYHYVGKSSDTRPIRSIFHFHLSSYLLFAKYVSPLLAIFNPVVLGMLLLRCLVVIFLYKARKKALEPKDFGQITAPVPVLHIITRLIVGGAQENTLLTAELLDKNAWKVHVLTGPQTGPEGSLMGYAKEKKISLFMDNALVREIHPLKDLISFVNMIRFIKKGRYTIVHTHSSKAGILGRWAAWAARTPVIIHTVHGWSFHDYQMKLVQGLYKLLERITLRITDKLIVVTKRDILKGSRAGIGKDKDYKLIRSGIELDAFAKPVRSPADIRKEVGIPIDALVVGTVTRLSPQKAPLVFIRAAETISRNNGNVHFLVVGDGPLRNDAENLVRKLNLQDRFHFTGIRRDVPNLLASFDIFALSSLWEGLPRVIPQAMANGKPVVVSAINGNREIVIDNENGLLFPQGDHAVMAHMITALSNDSDLVKKFVKKGHETVKEYDVNRMVSKISELYHHYLSEKNTRYGLPGHTDA